MPVLTMAMYAPTGTAKDELPAIHQQLRFNAKLTYDENHQLYRPASSPDYVGIPSPEIDAAWADILGGR